MPRFLSAIVARTPMAPLRSRAIPSAFLPAAGPASHGHDQPCIAPHSLSSAASRPTSGTEQGHAQCALARALLSHPHPNAIPSVHPNAHSSSKHLLASASGATGASMVIASASSLAPSASNARRGFASSSASSSSSSSASFASSEGGLAQDPAHTHGDGQTHGGMRALGEAVLPPPQVTLEQIAGAVGVRVPFPSSFSSSSTAASTAASSVSPSLSAQSSLPGAPASWSFYRRALPGELVHFNSAEGRRMFAEAVADGTMEQYFPLAEQFLTQAEPAYCAISTLAMCLNALGIDPNTHWKGPWRWYAEDQLECCISLDHIKRDGLTFRQFSSLARCHGVLVQDFRADRATVEDFRELVERMSTTSSVVATGHASASIADPERRGLGSALVVSYSRKSLKQTGDGHMSPIGGYHRASDSVLVLDVARFKYPPYWVPIPRMFEAMQVCDKVSGKARGYCVLSPLAAAPTTSSVHPITVPDVVSAGGGVTGSGVTGPAGVAGAALTNTALLGGVVDVATVGVDVATVGVDVATVGVDVATVGVDVATAAGDGGFVTMRRAPSAAMSAACSGVRIPSRVVSAASSLPHSSPSSSPASALPSPIALTSVPGGGGGGGLGARFGAGVGAACAGAEDAVPLTPSAAGSGCKAGYPSCPRCARVFGPAAATSTATAPSSCACSTPAAAATVSADSDAATDTDADDRLIAGADLGSETATEASDADVTASFPPASPSAPIIGAGRAGSSPVQGLFVGGGAGGDFVPAPAGSTSTTPRIPVTPQEDLLLQASAQIGQSLVALRSLSAALPHVAAVKRAGLRAAAAAAAAADSGESEDAKEKGEAVGAGGITSATASSAASQIRRAAQMHLNSQQQQHSPHHHQHRHHQQQQPWPPQPLKATHSTLPGPASAPASTAASAPLAPVNAEALQQAQARVGCPPRIRTWIAAMCHRDPKPPATPKRE